MNYFDISLIFLIFKQKRLFHPIISDKIIFFNNLSLFKKQLLSLICFFLIQILVWTHAYYAFKGREKMVIIIESRFQCNAFHLF